MAAVDGRETRLAPAMRRLSHRSLDTSDVGVFGARVVEGGPNGTRSDAVAVVPEGVVNGHVVVGLGATASGLGLGSEGNRCALPTLACHKAGGVWNNLA